MNVGCATRPVAILNQREETFLLTDISGSMSEKLDPGVTKREGAARASINLILNKFHIDPDDRIGVMVFDDSYRILLAPCPIRANKPDMIRIFQPLPSGVALGVGVIAPSRIQRRITTWFSSPSNP